MVSYKNVLATCLVKNIIIVPTIVSWCEEGKHQVKHENKRKQEYESPLSKNIVVQLVESGL